MLLRNFAQIITLIVSVATNHLLPDCIHFENGSGFIKLSPTPVVTRDMVISMEVIANNCDEISFTIHNGKSYVLTLRNEFMFDRDDGSVDRFEISNTCNGLWHEVRVELTEQQPLLFFGDRASYHDVRGYDLNELVNAFHMNPVYVGIHRHNNSWGARNIGKPFNGFIRNIKFNRFGQPPPDDGRLNGTLQAMHCPKELIFSKNQGAALLSENVTFNDNFRIFFEMKIAQCPDCCSKSAILLSAISDDSYFILEIVENNLYLKVRSQNGDRVVKLTSIFDSTLCDGKWHQIAVLQQGRDIRIIADNTSNSNNYALMLNFTAPLYIGHHPVFKLLSEVEIRNGFEGCFRSLHINGVVAKIMESNLNEYAKIED
ncbi:laminin subunit alpha-like [Bradysia coprophila]|uniref:laminin subunit alpha-like n=1 Tax=Bradysia coprophila TaxID=38358 RepID=UPI00187D75B1|nr:laminin subunit alpha-like [Bradysia coprophila]